MNDFKRGRPAKQYEGMTIHKKQLENPRREGTAGHKSWVILEDGMTYDEFIQAGGRRIDLAWELKKNTIELKEGK